MQDLQNTESTILQAAEKIFLENGYDGASMQMIASEAGINKALLHYYFRSKDKLFEMVFMKLFGKLIPPIIQVITSDTSFDSKIEYFVEHYIIMIQRNPLIPVFILHELTRNPDKLLNVLKSTGMNPSLFMAEVEKEIRQGNLVPVDPRQLLINILSLCVFPFAAKPLLKGMFFEGKEEDYQDFIESRKKSVAEFILNAIRKK